MVSIGATRELARSSRFGVTPTAARLALLLALATGAVLGFFITSDAESTQAVAAAGADLTRLLRAMAALKCVLAVAVAAVVLWRLGAAVTMSWFVAYAAGIGAMAVGPGLIWDMTYVGTGALLLHGGLLATLILIWRDPAMGDHLTRLVAERRAALRLRYSDRK